MVQYMGIEERKAKREARRKNGPVKRFFKGFFAVFFTLLAAVLIFAVGAIYIVERGPSPELRDIFVLSVQQSSAAKPLARLFLSEEQVQKILDDNTAKDDDLTTDTGLVTIDPGQNNTTEEDIIVEDVYGPTYRGKMMIVKDPSRVYVYTLPTYGGSYGVRVKEMVASEGAVAGINGGGFYDAGGMGNGTIPLGIVMSRGQWRNGNKASRFKLIGFDSENHLIVGNMTGYEAINMGMRDAIEWGPALIVNGEPVDVGNSGGLNPRSAIGQRADGAVLLLVIDGRQPSSMGATYLDLIGIMQNYGAVNAANLDGGNSSSMVYNGEIITHPSSLNGERGIPTAILVEAR